jgi:hypothetical protein
LTHLNDFEKSFVQKIGRLARAGIDFEALARESLTSKFGGAADVLLRDLSPKAFAQPEYFVKELSAIFGQGADGVLEPIAKYADLGLYGTKHDTPILQLLQRMGPPPSMESNQNTVLLHDYRIKDEQGNYPDEAN